MLCKIGLYVAHDLRNPYVVVAPSVPRRYRIPVFVMLGYGCKQRLQSRNKVVQPIMIHALHREVGRLCEKIKALGS